MLSNSGIPKKGQNISDPKNTSLATQGQRNNQPRSDALNYQVAKPGYAYHAYHPMLTILWLPSYAYHPMVTILCLP